MSDDDVEAAWRRERAVVVGSLARRFGDLELAEDAVSAAFVSAMRTWGERGVPDRPGAWLMTAAYRHAVSMRRGREIPVAELPEEDAYVGVSLDEPARTRGAIGGDDLLGLVVACCHPALDEQTRVALTLRHVCGLGVEEIAAAFLVSPVAMSKRLVRARRKIRLAGIPFEPPTRERLAARLHEVRSIIYLLFNEGYLSASPEQGGSPVRTPLCDEAIWLGGLVVEIAPEDETYGLLSLMLTTHARRDARVGLDGELQVLADQDRSLWDASMLARGRDALAATSGRRVGRYQIEAAIAVLEAAEQPAWPRIADLYALLAATLPSPLVEVQRAAAVGRADGPQAGLALLRSVIEAGELADHVALHAVLGELLEAGGDAQGAADSFATAAALASGPLQKRRLEERAQRAEQAAGAG